MGYSRRVADLIASKRAVIKGDFHEPSVMAQFINDMEDRGFSLEKARTDDLGRYTELFISDRLGGGRGFSISVDFIMSHEIKELVDSYNRCSDVNGRGPYILDGEGKISYDDPQELVNALLERAKKGLVVQRYKGLGEMNPEQLWETTMDPDKRHFVQVKVADEMEADGTFTLLMGDKVEPRREFIQNNALNVTELDI